MRKHTIILITAALTALLCQAHAFADAPEPSAHSAILTCADTGDVLYEKNADEPMLIASTTKIMTAIVVIENTDIDSAVEIKPEWCGAEGSTMYLQAGQRYTVRQLLLGLMLASGNDAAVALACNTAGDIDSFAAMMNEKAAELGMTNSSFKNPNGLDEDGHYSCARDLATLAAYCMENEDFADIVSRGSCTIGDLTFINHNKLLWNCEGCIGVKTGYTIAAGRTLVSCAQRGGMRLVCVTLNAPDDWDDHISLYDWGFSNYSLTRISPDSFSASIPIIASECRTGKLVPDGSITLLTDRGSEVTAKLEIPRFAYAGAFAGEKAGTVKLFVNGELAAQEDLVYTEDAPVNKDERLSAFERVMKFFGENSKPYYIADGDKYE